MLNLLALSYHSFAYESLSCKDPIYGRDRVEYDSHAKAFHRPENFISFVERIGTLLNNGTVGVRFDIDSNLPGLEPGKKHTTSVIVNALRDCVLIKKMDLQCRDLDVQNNSFLATWMISPKFSLVEFEQDFFLITISCVRLYSSSPHNMLEFMQQLGLLPCWLYKDEVSE